MRRITLTLAAILFSGLVLRAEGLRYCGTVHTEGGPATGPQIRKPASREGASPEGVRYDFEILVEGGKVRQNFLNDFASFKTGDYVLAEAATRTAAVVMLGKKEYMETDLPRLQEMMRQIHAPPKRKLSDPKVEVSDLPPKTIGQWSCAGRLVKISYTLRDGVAGSAPEARIEETTEYYSTDAFDMFKLFGRCVWHRQGIATGDEEFDILVAAKVGRLGFPAEIRTRRVVDGKDQGTTVFTVKEAHPVPVMAPGTFTIPSGFKKVPFAPQSLTEAPADRGGAGAGSGERPSQGRPDQEEPKKPKENP